MVEACESFCEVIQLKKINQELWTRCILHQDFSAAWLPSVQRRPGKSWPPIHWQGSSGEQLDGTASALTSAWWLVRGHRRLRSVIWPAKAVNRPDIRKSNTCMCWLLMAIYVINRTSQYWQELAKKDYNWVKASSMWPISDLSTAQLSRCHRRVSQPTSCNTCRTQF